MYNNNQFIIVNIVRCMLNSVFSKFDIKNFSSGQCIRKSYVNQLVIQIFIGH